MKPIFITILLLSVGSLHGASDEAKPISLAELSPNEVLAIAAHEIKAREITASNFQMVSLTYSFEADSWVVLYDNPNDLKIGGGQHFGFVIQDSRPHQVSFQAGL